jgi:hypothetical protein
VTTFSLKTRLKNFTSGISRDNQVVQGFAVVTNYCYSIDVNSAAVISPNTVHNLYRYRLDGTGQ